MGWQSRLPKDQKPEFVRTCNKCCGTEIRRRITDGVYRDPKTGFKTFNGNIDIECKCVEKAREASKNAVVVERETRCA